MAHALSYTLKHSSASILSILGDPSGWVRVLKFAANALRTRNAFVNAPPSPLVNIMVSISSLSSSFERGSSYSTKDIGKLLPELSNEEVHSGIAECIAQGFLKIEYPDVRVSLRRVSELPLVPAARPLTRLLVQVCWVSRVCDKG